MTEVWKWMKKYSPRNCWISLASLQVAGSFLYIWGQGVTYVPWSMPPFRGHQFFLSSQCKSSLMSDPWLLLHESCKWMFSLTAFPFSSLQWCVKLGARWSVVSLEACHFSEVISSLYLFNLRAPWWQIPVCCYKWMCSVTGQLVGMLGFSNLSC